MKMKKIYSILLGAAVLFSSSIASAQQLPNSNFDGSWVDCTPYSSGSSTKTGTQPSDWCVSNVSGVFVGLGSFGKWMGSTTIAAKVTPGHENSTSAVKLYNVENTYKSGEVVPGYMTLGTTWSTAKGAKAENKDGGTFGGIAFEYKPDAISFYYKRTHGTGTDATYNASEPATVITYLWKGSWSQADVPGNISLSNPTKITMPDREKNILGMTTDQGGAVTKSADAELIASLNYSIQGDAADWAYFEQPIPYLTTSTPEKINVIISAGDYFGGADVVGEDNTLIVDDISLVYYSRLSALSVSGVAIDGFDSKVYNYSIPSTDLPTEDQISATVMGQTATKSISIDEEAATVTIVVSNVDADNDGQSTHTYVLQYEKAGNEKVGVSTDYPGYLNVLMTDPETGTSGFIAENEEKVITITEYEDGTCDFLLPNFVLATEDGDMELGDILVEGATITKDEDGVSTYTGEIKDMPLLDGALVADVTLTGTISAAGVVDMKIDVLWMDIPINCTFTTNKLTGVENIIIENQGNVEYYNLQGVKVANPENGVFIRVQGGKATKVAM